MKIKFAILGAGSFAIALCKLISKNEKFEVTLWSALEDEIAVLKKYGENPKFLPGIKINYKNVKLTTDLNKVADADVLIFAVASKFVRKVAGMLKKVEMVNKNCIIVNTAKGLEEVSFKRMSEVIFDELGCYDSFVALSGPSHAEEIAKFVPTTIVAASKKLEVAERLQKILTSSVFRIYASDDVIGVELGGALKNPVALALGICDGLNLGENTKAALMTRGIVEIGRLGVKLGAKSQTFAGLSGIGDLIVTCISLHSRNKRAGILIGQGKSVDFALKEVNMVVEGYSTTKVANELSKKLDVPMPIVNELYEILYEGKDVESALSHLMSRPSKPEYEKLWFC